ncbi:hypothetical protein ACHAPA_009513 [Fusarium lateritium]
MQFLTTIITALAACQSASAWSLAIANTYGGTIQSGSNPPQLRRILSQDVKESACGVFCQGLPGVRCEQETMDGESPQACVGDFETNSLTPQFGTSCTFYKNPDCSAGGEKTIERTRPEGILTEDNAQGFTAFQCWDNGAFVPWKA